MFPIRPPVSRPIARPPSRSPSPPRAQQQRQPSPQSRSPQRQQQPTQTSGRGWQHQASNQPGRTHQTSISGGGWQNSGNVPQNQEQPPVLRLRGGAPSIGTLRSYVRAAQRDYDQAVRAEARAKQKYDNLNMNKTSSRNEQAIADAKTDWENEKLNTSQLKQVLDNEKQTLEDALASGDIPEE